MEGLLSVMKHLFEGLKIIDCASFIAAPAAATVLSDFGADVIKIEPPTGDAFRQTGLAPGQPATEGARDRSPSSRRPTALRCEQRVLGLRTVRPDA